MAITKPRYKIKYSSQEIDNLTYDEDTKTKLVTPVGWDGDSPQRLNADNFATIIVESGTDTYIADAAPGSLDSEAVWKIKKIDEASGTIVGWADGNASFDNLATDLPSLSYS